MKYECPICQADLIHISNYERFVSKQIDKDGNVSILCESTTGTETWVSCSVNADHNIPDELSEKVIEMVILEAANKK